MQSRENCKNNYGPRCFIEARRVLGNLVINAVQAMLNEGELKIRARQEAGDNVITI